MNQVALLDTEGVAHELYVDNKNISFKAEYPLQIMSIDK